jgi:hypothetical protein
MNKKSKALFFIYLFIKSYISVSLSTNKYTTAMFIISLKSLKLKLVCACYPRPSRKKKQKEINKSKQRAKIFILNLFSKI